MQIYQRHNHFSTAQLCVKSFFNNVYIMYEQGNMLKLLPWLLQDAAFIELQRQQVFTSQAASSDQAPDVAMAAQGDTQIRGEDYQKLKMWKDLVGAPTFSQLHTRVSRYIPRTMLPQWLESYCGL